MAMSAEARTALQGLLGTAVGAIGGGMEGAAYAGAGAVDQGNVQTQFEQRDRALDIQERQQEMAMATAARDMATAQAKLQQQQRNNTITSLTTLMNSQYLTPEAREKVAQQLYTLQGFDTKDWQSQLTERNNLADLLDMARDPSMPLDIRQSNYRQYAERTGLNPDDANAFADEFAMLDPEVARGIISQLRNGEMPEDIGDFRRLMMNFYGPGKHIDNTGWKMIMGLTGQEGIVSLTDKMRFAQFNAELKAEFGKETILDVNDMFKYYLRFRMTAQILGQDIGDPRVLDQQFFDMMRMYQQGMGRQAGVESTIKTNVDGSVTMQNVDATERATAYDLLQKGVEAGDITSINQAMEEFSGNDSGFALKSYEQTFIQTLIDEHQKRARAAESQVGGNQR